jgi:hypothetical protein
VHSEEKEAKRGERKKLEREKPRKRRGKREKEMMFGGRERKEGKGERESSSHIFIPSKFASKHP